MWEEVAIFVIVSVISFFIGVLLRPTQKGTVQSIIRTINFLKKKGWKLLVRPNGEIFGVIDHEEPFFDDTLKTNRKRYVFRGMDGKQEKENRDIFNSKTGALENLIAVEKDGGIALTQKAGNPDGEFKLIEIHVGGYRKSNDDDVTALKNELDDRAKEHKVAEDNYKLLQSKYNDDLHTIERQEGQLIEIRRTNQTLLDSNEALRTRAIAAEAGFSMALGELKLFKQMHGDLADEIDTIMEKVKSRMKKEVMVGGLEPAPTKRQPPAPPAEKPAAETAAETPPKKQKEKKKPSEEEQLGE